MAGNAGSVTLRPAASELAGEVAVTGDHALDPSDWSLEGSHDGRHWATRSGTGAPPRLPPVWGP
ncbi:hypothetical protein [Streptomyces yatensis]|uniref:Uncharacterized protein n=1 Tax=Streptomyces yatensis TaxID=155177 RepID=A0ABP4UQJ2_9ACTN|nr:hypothetical protein [Streptomyces yatensis]